MKKILAYLFVLNIIASFSYGASIDVVEKIGSFSCTVLANGVPIKEIDGVAVLQFDSEYKLLLKNNNDRKAVANITIDGASISSFGDLVINANSEVTLERFITKSLDSGKRFKFVPLDNPEVDDPARIENGVIRVEFRLEKKQEYVQLDFWHLAPIYDNGTLDLDSDNLDITFSSTNILVSNTAAHPGATIGGSVSEQKFHKVDIELDDKIYIIIIKLKGV